MLVIGRREGERIRIMTPDGPLWLLVVEATGGRVRLGFRGPASAEILREELVARKEEGERNEQ